MTAPSDQEPGEVRWAPSGIVTWTTDFGLADPWVGIMKGVVLSRLREATQVDLTHAVPAQDVRVGAWYLAHAWRWFPSGSVHVAVVDPGVGSERRILVAEQQGHAFLAPDNGLLSGVLSGVLGGSARVWSLDVGRFAASEVSATFHGRDVFAPAAAAIAGGTPPERTGAPITDWCRAGFPSPERAVDGGIETEVLLVDRFGNLICGFAPDEGERDLRGWVVEIGGREVRSARTYAEVAPGELCALVDSYGHVEIAQRDGDAACALGLGPGARVKLTPVRASD